jgi:hypothetical protein
MTSQTKWRFACLRDSTIGEALICVHDDRALHQTPSCSEFCSHINRYPGHAPVECVSIGHKHVCGLRLGETFAMPVFNHFGSNAGFPQSCNW